MDASDESFNDGATAAPRGTSTLRDLLGLSQDAYAETQHAYRVQQAREALEERLQGVPEALLAVWKTPAVASDAQANNLEEDVSQVRKMAFIGIKEFSPQIAKEMALAAEDSLRRVKQELSAKARQLSDSSADSLSTAPHRPRHHLPA